MNFNPMRRLQQDWIDAHKEPSSMAVLGGQETENLPSLGDRQAGEVFQPPKASEEEVTLPIAFRQIGEYPCLQIVPPHPSVGWSPGSNAAGAHTLTYHGGPTVHVPKLYIVYAGFNGDRALFERFTASIMADGYLAGLGNYGSGNGQFLGSFGYSGAVPSVVDDNAWVRPFIQWVTLQPGVPQPDTNTMYAVLFGPNATVQISGQSSCSAFCGYHSGLNDGRTLYLVLPDTSCGPCHGTHTPVEALQMVTSHEVAECATNPWGSGWYEDSTGMENGDICAWPASPPMFGPWTVQGYYTNEAGCTMGAYAPGGQPGGQPQPDSQLAGRVAALETWRQSLGGWFNSHPQ